MIISIDEEMAFENSDILDKNSQKNSIEKFFLHWIIRACKKIPVNVILNSEHPNAFPLRSGTKQH